MKLFRKSRFFIMVKITGKNIFVIMLLVVCALLLTISQYLPPLPKVQPPSLIGTVVIDPGHGGIDGGTHDNQGMLEKNINLEVALYIRKELEEKGVRTVMTRTEDVSLDGKSRLRSTRHRKDLDARKNIINGSNADLFISLHVNANPRRLSQRGTSIFYKKNNALSKELAVVLADTVDDIVNAGYLENEDLYPEILQNSSFYLLNTVNIPGVIYEMAFITNPQDNLLLQDEMYKRMVALSVSEGIIKYLLDEKKK